MNKVLPLILILFLVAAGCAPRPAQSWFAQAPHETMAPATAAPTEAPMDFSLVLLPDDPQQAPAATESPVQYGEDYDDRDRVALYLHLYGELPPHFLTKEEARKLGWDGGEVEDFLDGAAIGGDVFGNYEGRLPKRKGRVYYECDIGTVGRKKRGEKRVIWSNDGLIYYTDDHYETFTLLYGEE